MKNTNPVINKKYEYYRVLELNTRKVTFSDDITDIFYGEDYTYHIVDTLEEAKTLATKLESKGIATSIAHIFSDTDPRNTKLKQLEEN